MRVTGGIAKGILLKAPKGLKTRPTSDKVRQAIFQTLGESIEGTHVLDLFAGTGALGIEAISHGAEFAVFVEESPSAVRIIRQNLEKTNLTGKAEVVPVDFRIALRMLSRQNRRFHLVLADPPYGGDLLEQCAALLREHPVLAPDGVVVLEHFKKVVPPPQVAGIALDRTRFYGQTAISYYLAGKGCELAGIQKNFA